MEKSDDPSIIQWMDIHAESSGQSRFTILSTGEDASPSAPPYEAE